MNAMLLVMLFWQKINDTPATEPSEVRVPLIELEAPESKAEFPAIPEAFELEFKKLFSTPEDEPKVREKKLPSWYNPEFAALFSERTICYSGRGYRSREFKYRLFVPAISTNKKLPLIIWLHGAGEAGSDNVDQLKFIDEYVIAPPWKRERFPFFVLAVQCPRDNGSWTTGAEDADDMVNVVRAALEQTLRDYPMIDTGRVSLVGVSAGGSGSWELAMRHPEVFSCVAPTGSGGGDNLRVHVLKDVPVWAFHSIKDRGVKIDGVRETVEALKAVGGKVELTEINSADHFCWRMAFDDYDLLGWLLAQKRGGTAIENEPASDSSLPAMVWVVPLVVIGAILLLWQLAKRNRGWTRMNADEVETKRI